MNPGPLGVYPYLVRNFRDRQLIGFAFGAKQWYPVRGSFKVVK